MGDHRHLLAMGARSLGQQQAVRRATFSPGEIKTLRRFSIWEIGLFMVGMPADTQCKKLAARPALPQGVVESKDKND